MVIIIKIKIACTLSFNKQLITSSLNTKKSMVMNNEIKEFKFNYIS